MRGALLDSQGVLQAASGTLANPSIGFKRERMGLYRASAGQLALSIGGFRVADWTQNDMAVRSNAVGSVAPLALIRANATSADDQELRVDAYETSVPVGRIANYRQTSTKYGWKWYGYSTGLHAAPAMTLDGDKNLSVGGGISGAGGGITAAGALTAGTGTFTGALSGTTGAFSGLLTSAGLTSSGAISGTTGTFSGAVSGTTGTFSGALSGVGVAAGAGAITGASLTVAGAVSAATGAFSGALAAAGISGTTGTFSGRVLINGAVDYGSMLHVHCSTYPNRGFTISDTIIAGTRFDMYTSQGTLYLAFAGAECFSMFANGLTPSTHNTHYLGDLARRWREIHATDGIFGRVISGPVLVNAATGGGVAVDATNVTTFAGGSSSTASAFFLVRINNNTYKVPLFL